MSASEEANAAAEAAASVGLPYVVTYSFDTAGRTMMGLLPRAAAATLAGQAVPPVAMGANCGVGAPDILVSLTQMRESPFPLVSKGNCGVPHFEGTEVVYSGTPELMAATRAWRSTPERASLVAVAAPHPSIWPRCAPPSTHTSAGDNPRSRPSSLDRAADEFGAG